MANIFFNLPMPVANGPGASVDVSTMGKDKTIVVGGAFTGASVAIEISVDGGVTFQPIKLFTFADKQVIPVVAQFMRVNVLGRSAEPFSATANVGANDNGALFAALPVPAVDGPGASVDVSTLGNFTTFVVGGSFNGATISIEVSEDGVDFAPCGTSFSGQGGTHSKVVVANFMRTFVRGRNAFPFVPVVAVGAEVDPTPGGGSVAASLTPNPFLLPASTIAVTADFGEQIRLDASGGPIAQTLPVINTAVLPNPGGFLVVVEIGGGQVTLNAGVGDTVNGGASFLVPLSGGVLLESDGVSNWDVVAVHDPTPAVAAGALEYMDTIEVTGAPAAFVTFGTGGDGVENAAIDGDVDGIYELSIFWPKSDLTTRNIEIHPNGVDISGNSQFDRHVSSGSFDNGAGWIVARVGTAGAGTGVETDSIVVINAATGKQRTIKSQLVSAAIGASAMIGSEVYSAWFDSVTNITSLRFIDRSTTLPVGVKLVLWRRVAA